VHAGQRDDTDVDVVAVDGQAHPAVLGQAPLGDVQLGHDLHARHHAAHHALGDGGRRGQDAVDAEAHAHLVAVGLEVDVRRRHLHRLGHDRVHELDDRGVVGRLEQVHHVAAGGGLLGLVLLDRLLDHVVEAIEACDQRQHVLAGGHRGPHLHTDHDRHVVDRQDVGRVDHRHQDRALVDERHRHRLVALGGGGRDRVGRPHVDLEDRQVEMVEAVALGRSASQLVPGERALLLEQLLGGPPRGAGGLHRRVDLLPVDEAQLDDDVGEEPARAAAAGGRGDAGGRRLRARLRGGRGRGIRPEGRDGAEV
jgi:hypothetical protein